MIGGVRYDAAEPLEKRLQDFPFAIDRQASLAAFLDQMKGARLELRLGSDTVAGTIVSARTSKPDEKTPERETVVLLTDSGEIRTFDLGAASSVKLSDPKLQGLLRDYLTVLSGARSKDRRSVYIDASRNGDAAAGRQLHDALGGVEVELPADLRAAGGSRRSKAGRSSTTPRARIGPT